MSYFARNGAFILYNNGVGVLTSDGSGPIVPGGHHFKINAGTWTGEHVGKIQYHSNNLYNQYSSYWIARNASGTNTFTIDSSGNFSSDARKKENITTVTDALTKVSQLRGVEFNWKEKYGSKEDMGLIAQEVETVFPRLISDSPDPEGAEKENKEDKKLTPEEQFQARLKLSKIPRNASKVRIRNRCVLTGRSRGVYRKLVELL